MIPIVILAIENDADRRFMEQLYEHHQSLITSNIHSVLRDKQYVEDVVGEVCLLLIDNLHTLSRLSQPAQQSYISTTARNAAINFSIQQVRQRTRNASDPYPALEMHEADGEHVDAQLLFAEQIAEIKRAIKTLPEKERMYMEMRFIQELDVAQIAQVLEVKEDSVRKTLLRARKRIYDGIQSEVRHED